VIEPERSPALVVAEEPEGDIRLRDETSKPAPTKV
jgi:hypothetical protein